MLYRFRNKQPEIGENAYVSEQAILIGDVKIGNDCYVGPGAIIRGDYGTIEVGAGTAVEEGVVIHAPPGGLCKIGRKVTLGHGAILHSNCIGDLAVIGMGAIISLESQVGVEAVVAEGSVVRTKQIVPPAVIVGGNPAKVIKPITDDNKKFFSEAKQSYIDLAHEYLKNGLLKLDPSSKIK